MKPENTLENKANFIMLYFNQKVLCFRNTLEPIIYVGLDDQISLGKARKEDFLLLTPLSQITDEDAIEITKISICRNPFAVHVKRSECGEIEIENISHHSTWKLFISGVYIYFKCGNSRREIDSTAMLEIYDYLRSKGYALPWMGLSVDELVEYGWVKLKDND
jgi:hypothetical protein